MVTWSTGGDTFLVTQEQKSELDSVRDEFESLMSNREKSLEGDYRYDGKHMGNAPDPFKDLAARYLERIREILGDSPVYLTRAYGKVEITGG